MPTGIYSRGRWPYSPSYLFRSQRKSLSPISVYSLRHWEEQRLSHIPLETVNKHPKEMSQQPFLLEWERPSLNLRAKTLDIVIAGDGPLSRDEFNRWRAFLITLHRNTRWLQLTGYNCYNRRRTGEPYDEELALHRDRLVRLKSTKTFRNQSEVDTAARYARLILEAFGFDEEERTDVSLGIRLCLFSYVLRIEGSVR